METVKLTQFSRAAGCGCKIAPSVLEEILKNAKHETPNFPQLLVGNSSNDDAAAYAINDTEAIISTTDFFLPIVDDPFDFGRIAAANAISDVYAMGGKPLMALGILGIPVEKISTEVAGAILAGAQTICKEANIPLAGGHSIDSVEPIFGLAVTGLVNKKNLKRNNTAQSGDTLYLTKPIGTGVLSTALKRGLLNELDYASLLQSMTMLNKIGEDFGKLNGVHAMTDVTGFGILGHLMEMCEGANLSAELFVAQLPLLPGTAQFISQFVYPDNTTRILNTYKDKVSGMDGLEFLSLCDPQTNGGLLVAVAPEAEAEFLAIFKSSDYFEACAKPIGKMIYKTEKFVTVLV